MNAKITLAVRILLGLMMLIFGINKFANFLPMPAIPGDGGTLMGIYATSGFMYIIGVLEILIGLALLLNKYVPLALTFSVAIMFNAVIFHLLHDPVNTGAAAFGLILSLYLVYTHKVRFLSLLSA